MSRARPDESWLHARGYVLDGDTARQRRPGSPEPAPGMPEAALLAWVRRTALENGWLYWHCYDSRGSDLGYPDVTLVKPGHPLILAECKTATGKLTIEQQRWLEFLPQATGVYSGLWRPQDKDMILELLTRKRP